VTLPGNRAAIGENKRQPAVSVETGLLGSFYREEINSQKGKEEKQSGQENTADKEHFS